MNLKYRFAFCLAFVAALIVAGCSKPTGELSGSVTYKNKSVVTGTVTVTDANKKVYQGTIDQGQYSIKGIPVGPVTMIVTSPDPNASAPPPMPTGGAGPAGTPGGVGNTGPRTGGRETKGLTPATPIAGWFAIPKKYEEPSTSNLKTDIKVGPNTYDIKLDD
jgi:hypothetical protein